MKQNRIWYTWYTLCVCGSHCFIRKDNSPENLEGIPTCLPLRESPSLPWKGLTISRWWIWDLQNATEKCYAAQEYKTTRPRRTQAHTKFGFQLFQAFRACLSYHGMSRHALGLLVLCPSNRISLSIFLLLLAKAFPAEKLFSRYSA